GRVAARDHERVEVGRIARVGGGLDLDFLLALLACDVLACRRAENLDRVTGLQQRVVGLAKFTVLEVVAEHERDAGHDGSPCEVSADVTSLQMCAEWKRCE